MLLVRSSPASAGTQRLLPAAAGQSRVGTLSVQTGTGCTSIRAGDMIAGAGGPSSEAGRCQGTAASAAQRQPPNSRSSAQLLLCKPRGSACVLPDPTGEACWQATVAPQD